MDKFTLKNSLAKFTPQVIQLFNRYKNSELSSSEVDNLLLDITKDVLVLAKNKREERKFNIPEDSDLLTNKMDKSGRKRFSLKTMDDTGVMAPDEDGYWTPIID